MAKAMWEYHVLSMPTVRATPRSIQEYLNALGETGWELSTTCAFNDTVYFTLRRALVTPPSPPITTPVSED
jgi:hypothetical protein